MECFAVYSNEIEGRIDPFYYRKEFRDFDNTIKRFNYDSKKLVKISKVICGPFGSSIKVKDYRNSGVPLIRIVNINNNQQLSQENTIYISEDLATKLKPYRVVKGDLIISQRGTLGLIATIPDFFENAIICANFIAVKDIKKVSDEYLKIFLTSKYGQIQLIRKISGQVQTKITTDDIKNLIIVIPPLPIQNRIVKIMDNAYKIKKQKEAEAKQLLISIDEFVLNELGIKLPELKDRMTFVVQADDVKDKRIDAYYRHPKFEEVEEVIEKGKYRTRKLKEFITKIHYGASVKNVYIDEGIPLLRIMNLKENRVDLTDVVKLPESMRKELGKAFVNEGDLLISRSGTVGIVSVIPKNAAGYAFGSFMIKFCLSDEINKEYISIWLNSIISKLLTERDKIGAIQGNITISTIENFKIPFPQLSIQNKIAEEVKRRMQKAEKLNKEAKQLLEEAKEKVEKMILSE